MEEKYGCALHSAINFCLTNYTEMQVSKLNLSFISTKEVTYPEDLFLKQMIILSDTKNHQAVSLNFKFKLFYTIFS